MTAAADRMRSRRQREAAPGGWHDRAVRIAATVLPGAVGALLAVMLFAPLSPRGEISFLLDRTRVAIVDDRMRVAAAHYRGLDDAGRDFTVSAGSAVQHSAHDDRVAMSDVTASIVLRDGPAVLTTREGVYDFAHALVTVPGMVSFRSADGYRLAARGADIDLGARALVSKGPVSGNVPAGTFAADRFTANLDARTVNLIGHARLNIQPGQRMLLPTHTGA